ncbi:hypothetical protein Nepgr_013605 [Nepenthes gracilis]|uniref:Uncharacterized protein n=1 Tax=Nepenthes gracilis TaxID=150966 RepID=A0AAD3SJD8_NEPGR|nr:hypothetical protein Nepgr_013605 [Nepenthes gracilis]
MKAERVRDDSVVAVTVNCRNRNQRDTPMLSLKRDWIRQGGGQLCTDLWFKMGMDYAASQQDIDGKAITHLS